MTLSDPLVASPDASAPPGDLSGVALLFDFDGTLVPLAPLPDAVTVPPALIDRLQRLHDRLPGRVAIVSGRDVATIDRLLGPVVSLLAVAGSHGAEFRDAGVPIATVAPPPGLAAAAADLAVVAAAHGFFLERKPMGVGLHYRLAADKGALADAAAARAADAHGLVLQRGKMMAEVRAPGDKGRAVDRLLQLPAMAGRQPLFFGDDVTDEDGFRAVERHGGAGVLVGDARLTAARYRLADPAAVAGWIDGALRGMDG